MDDLSEAECEELVNKCSLECGRCEKEDVAKKQTTPKPTEPATAITQPLNFTHSPDKGKPVFCFKSGILLKYTFNMSLLVIIMINKWVIMVNTISYGRRWTAMYSGE